MSALFLIFRKIQNDRPWINPLVTRIWGYLYLKMSSFSPQAFLRCSFKQIFVLYDFDVICNLIIRGGKPLKYVYKSNWVLKWKAIKIIVSVWFLVLGWLLPPPPCFDNWNIFYKYPYFGKKLDMSGFVDSRYINYWIIGCFILF